METTTQVELDLYWEKQRQAVEGAMKVLEPIVTALDDHESEVGYHMLAFLAKSAQTDEQKPVIDQMLRSCCGIEDLSNDEYAAIRTLHRTQFFWQEVA